MHDSNDITKRELEKLSQREDSNFKMTLSLLREIKDEIHANNNHVTELHAATELKMLKLKAEIYDTVFDKLVDNKEFSSVKRRVDNEIVSIKKSLEDKVDKNSVKLIWFTLTAVTTTLMGVLTYKGD